MTGNKHHAASLYKPSEGANRLISMCIFNYLRLPQHPDDRMANCGKGHYGISAWSWSLIPFWGSSNLSQAYIFKYQCINSWPFDFLNILVGRRRTRIISRSSMSDSNSFWSASNLCSVAFLFINVCTGHHIIFLNTLVNGRQRKVILIVISMFLADVCYLVHSESHLISEVFYYSLPSSKMA